MYDPTDKEIVEGATLTLKGADGATYTATTDGFGDFWFRGLADGASYTLTIAAPGFAAKTIDGDQSPRRTSTWATSPWPSRARDGESRRRAPRARRRL